MILVDPLRQYAKSPLGPREWCHMVSDASFIELHEFAEKVGMKRAWFQGDHYDLVTSRRARAVELGAQEVDSQELVRRMIGQRGDRLRALLEKPA